MSVPRLAKPDAFFGPVEVFRVDDEHAEKVWGCELCAEGIFLQSNRPWPVGQRVGLKLDVDGQRVFIRTAEVVGVRPFEPINVDGRMPGMRVRFLAVDPPYRAALRRYGMSTPPLSLVPQLAEPVLVDSDPPPPPRLGAPFGGGPGASMASSFDEGAPLRPLSLPPVDDEPAWSLGDPQLAGADLDDERAFEPLDTMPDAVPEYGLQGWSFERIPPPILDDAEPAEDHRRAVEESRASVRDPVQVFTRPFHDDDLPLANDSDVFSTTNPGLSQWGPAQRPAALRRAAAVAVVIGGAAIGVVLGLYTGGPPSVPLDDVAPSEPQDVPPKGAPQVASAPPAVDEPLPVALVEAPLREKPAVKAAPPPEGTAVQAAPPQAAPPAPAEKAPTSSTLVAPVLGRGEVVVPLEGGHVVKAFALAGPGRVVVDLAETRYPGFIQQDVGMDGIARLRIGRPSPGLVRVVVELDSAAAPQGVEAQKDADRLTLTWR